MERRVEIYEIEYDFRFNVLVTLNNTAPITTSVFGYKTYAQAKIVADEYELNGFEAKVVEVR